ncbi:MAG: cytochrome c biogenesis protein [Coriobacteriia bacterium]|nr:cytochrome c biogenesis protein [Coriobacteriia bacterium]
MSKLQEFAKSFTQKRELQITIVLAIFGAILTTAAFVMAFTSANMQYHDTTVTVDYLLEDKGALLAPPAQQVGVDEGFVYITPWFSQKIFYFHVPIAQLSLVVFSLAAIFGIIFLRTRNPNYDLRSRIAMETTLIFTLGTMITGSLWTRASWLNSWGELGSTLLSEPRLVTYTVMLMFVVAYFVLRKSVEGEEKKATYSAVFAILAWIIVPFSFLYTRLTQEAAAHPTDAVNTGMDPSNLLPFIVCIFGMMMLGYAIYILRVAEEKKRTQLEEIKETIEDSLSKASKAKGVNATNQYSAAVVLNKTSEKQSSDSAQSASKDGGE